MLMEATSPNTEDILEEEDDEIEDEGEQLFGFEHNDHDDGSDSANDSQQNFQIDGNDHENDREQLFEFSANDHENNAETILEVEVQGHRNCSEHALEVKGNYHEKGSMQMPEVEDNEEDNEQRDNTSSIDDQCSISQSKNYSPPVVGMEFESYDDAYYYYNCYARELGFAIRVKSSWTKRNSKEKRGAVLCCNCEGFKTVKEASNRRKETRTGCLAMIRLRLVESNRWRVDEIKHEHNHLFDPRKAQNSKSHKKIEAGTKRKLEATLDVEVQTIKLYRTPAIDASGSGSMNCCGKGNGNYVQPRHLRLKDGDLQAIYSFFCRIQLTNPNFVYLIDLTDEGQLRNVFWIDPRSRAAYNYFGDVVAIDATCLSNKCEIPLIAFVGLNHHGQSILLGCALLADETLETYVWLFRAWLTCMLGHPPQIIVTDQCKTIQSAIAEVFPRAQHRLYLPLIMQRILRNMGLLQDYEAFHSVLNRTVYGSLKADEFENAWEKMIQHFGIQNHTWLHNLFEDRERWAPVYLKEIFLAGLLSSQADEYVIPFFDGYVHKQTCLKDFFDIYDQVSQKKYQMEALLDFESGEYSPSLRTSCPYELQLSKLYTKEIFEKFQHQVEMLSTCVSISEVHVNGPIITYMIREREFGTLTEYRNLEVVYDKATVEVRCMCGCFYLNGYLCRHALCVLNYNGVDNIPLPYILSRWRKDVRRLYIPEIGSNTVDISNPVQWYDHLYRRAIQVVEEGMASQDHYMVAWQAFKESLNKVRLTADKHVQ